MREYRFSDDGIRTLRIRFIGIVVVLALVVVAAGVAATGLRRSTTTADLATFAIALTVAMPPVMPRAAASGLTSSIGEAETM
jgi:hypothetical protein